MHGSLTHPHWAGLTSCTNPFGLAASSVFVKQSSFPGHCDLTLTGQAPLLPKVQGQIADFPELDYPRRLPFLRESTCVGSGYGHLRITQSSFHGPWDLTELPIQGAYPAFTSFFPLRSRSFNGSISRGRYSIYPQASKTSLSVDGAGILTCFPFARFFLRTGLGPTNPQLFDIAGETLLFRRLGL